LTTKGRNEAMPRSQWGLGKVINGCSVKMLCTDLLWEKCGYVKGSPVPQLYKIHTNSRIFCTADSNIA